MSKQTDATMITQEQEKEHARMHEEGQYHVH
jgi:hypothetical protein